MTRRRTRPTVTPQGPQVSRLVAEHCRRALRRLKWNARFYLTLARDLGR